MGCNCGPKKNAPSNGASAMQMMSQGESVMQQNDVDFIEIVYNHRNKGQHGVRGAATGTFYGYRKGGDTFLVHVRDQQAQPQLFIVEKPVLASAPKINYSGPRVKTPAPKRFEADKEKESVLAGELSNVKEALDLQSLPGVTPTVARNLTKAGLTSKEAILSAGIAGLTDVKGIAEARATAIMDYLSS